MPRKRQLDPKTFPDSVRSRFRKEEERNPPVSVLSSSESDSDSELDRNLNRPSQGPLPADPQHGQASTSSQWMSMRGEQSNPGNNKLPLDSVTSNVQHSDEDESETDNGACSGDQQITAAVIEQDASSRPITPVFDDSIVQTWSPEARNENDRAEDVSSQEHGKETEAGAAANHENEGETAGEGAGQIDDENGSQDELDSEKDDENDSHDELDSETDVNDTDDNEEWEDADEDNNMEQGIGGRGGGRNPVFDFDNEPLYPGAPLTVGQSLVSTLLFVLIHSLTGSCISDLLSLVFLHCIKPTRFKETLYKFKKYFADLKAPLTFEYFCDKCFTPLKGKIACHECRNEGVRYFLRLSVENQCKNLFARPGFYNLLQHRFTRPKRTAENLEDIFDGKMYHEHREFTNNPNNITFTLYTDGVSIYKSSKFSVWLLLLCINELPFKERIKKENMILCGLWFGIDKPNANLFMLPFYDDFARLFQGILIKVHNTVEPILVRCLCLCFTMDMDAKACFCHMIKWSGYYSCLKCLIKGEKSERTSNVMVFPFDEFVRPRTAESYHQSAASAVETKTVVLGVKGPSILSALFPNRDLVACVPIDSMHCLFQGLVKKLMTLWFLSDFRASRFSISTLTFVICDRLNEVLPLSYVQRLPRSLEDLSYWKASEVRNWFFFYSVAILHDILLPEYFEHYLMLVHGIYLLNTDSISPADIDRARVLLNKFVMDFERLYGVKHMTLNLHSLVHLPDCVLDFGQLWVYSCFPFESINGEFVKMIHGTRYAEVQLASVATLHMNLPTIVSEMPPSDVRQFCQRLLKKGHVKKTLPVCENTYAVGKLEKLTHVPDEIERALACSGVRYRNLRRFRKLLKNGDLYFSQSYVRKVKTNSACVSYTTDGECNLGLISSFVYVTLCDCREVCQCDDGVPYAVVTKLDNIPCFSISQPNTSVSFIQECTVSENVEAVHTNNLLGLNFVVKVDEKLFTIQPPNKMERE